MNILITGGTGLIGSAFINKFKHKYNFDVLSRPNSGALQLLKNVKIINHLSDIESLDKYDAVINLAGEPIVNKRWSKAQKIKICQSRWQLTNKLSKMFNDASSPPHTFISGSAIGFYGRQRDEKIIEEYTDVYPEFSHRICKVWEDKAKLAQKKSRLCILRTGVVLDKHKGALAKMLPAYKFGLGGKLSRGIQYMSWIHIDDMVNAIEFLLTNEQCYGEFNMTAPKPVTNKEFSQTLATQLHRPNVATMPAFVLRLLFGEMADLLLYGQNVIPKNLLDNDFKFQYPTLDKALNNLLG
ncbi:TIGR01777 family oxidoreductase [Thalassotalea crassostreae]|uniref:TIGR01777 family oxidoreductase n=1 Tax=Thalassotalea crassostreae TaxID=1763536 RepID=UPI000838E608|nr:TIGR01777 family oxidoreductase [Thalassotalea crassostreae]